MDPAEERREMKRHKQYMTMLGYVADSEYGIPTKCLCGERIVDETGGIDDVDTLPGKRFFTCNKYKNDGFHYRLPWVFSVHEEIERLIKRVEAAEEVIKGVPALQSQITSLKAHVGLLNEQVDILNGPVYHLEKINFE